MNHYEGSNNHIDPSQAQFGPSNQDEIRSYINTYLDSTLQSGNIKGFKTGTIDCQKLAIPDGAIDVRKLGVIPCYRGYFYDTSQGGGVIANNSGADMLLSDTPTGASPMWPGTLRTYPSMRDGVNNALVYAPLRGIYAATYGFSWSAAASTGGWFSQVLVDNQNGNGFQNTVVTQGAVHVAWPYGHSNTIFMPMVAGGVCKVSVQNSTGANMSVAGATANWMSFQLTYIGKITI